MRLILPVAALALTAFSVQAALTKPKPDVKSAAPAMFRDGAASTDELAQRLMSALEAKDKEALDKLLITKSEYVDFILPGSVPVGDPPRWYGDQMKDYAWGTMYGKTIYYRANLIDQFGGHHYKIKSYEFRRGVHDYAWYRAHELIKINLEAENGHEAFLQAGSVAEVDGRFKLISLINH
jgi:hypothetical protein